MKVINLRNDYYYLRFADEEEAPNYPLYDFFFAIPKVKVILFITNK